jgi:mannose/fructose/N-acetylgalactosamine-specific phosphotransferase system component IIC
MWTEASLLFAAIVVAFIGLFKNESWAHNPWLIPILIALVWGTLQDGWGPY